MFVLMISMSSLKLGHLISETSSPGQIKGKPCCCARGRIFSSPEQHSRRAIVLPPALALASTNVKVFVSSPEQKLRVSYCHHPLSVVRRQQLVC